VNALKTENITWAVIRNHDYLPYSWESDDDKKSGVMSSAIKRHWSGYFSSRPGLKK
jgi:hypothetical protein